MNLKEFENALKAIAEGYPYEIKKEEFDHFDQYYVVVENPDFIEDNGSNTNLVFEVNSGVSYILDRDQRIANLNSKLLDEVNTLWDSKDEKDQKALAALVDAVEILENYLYPINEEDNDE